MGAMDTLNSLSNPLTSAASAIPAKNTALLAGQDVKTGDLLGRYTGSIGGQEKTADMYSRLGAQSNLPTLQANANALNQAVFNAPRVATTAVRGNEVTQNQLDRMISGQLSKLSPAAQMATNQAQTAEGNVAKMMGFEQADQAKALLPYEMETNMLNDRLARETTLYTTGNEQELNALLSKMQAGVTLTEGESNRANQLAMAELSYKAEKEKLAQNADQFKVTSANDKQKNLIELAKLYKK